MRPLLSFLLFYVSTAYAQFDHSHKQWSNVLNKYTRVEGKQTLVNYKKLKSNPTELNLYLSSLEKLDFNHFEKFTSKEKLAFWINAYNAFTMKIIVDHYPVKSIKEIEGGLFGSGPWKLKFIKLFNKKMSLDQIEHDTIRKQYKEPRIHFAVNCASIGCPSLLREAFVAEAMDQQLDRAALNFLTNKDKNLIVGNQMKLSKIFKWYGDDFQEAYESFQNYIIKTLNLLQINYDIEYNEYNWNLNE